MIETKYYCIYYKQLVLIHLRTQADTGTGIPTRPHSGSPSQAPSPGPSGPISTSENTLRHSHKGSQHTRRCQSHSLVLQNLENEDTGYRLKPEMRTSFPLIRIEQESMTNK